MKKDKINSFNLKKQNEKNERIIRELMKFEENKKCFDCSSKVITYVNLSINTFICTECGGLLREINHRIKNISLSTFTAEEIKGLQNGGNKKAKDIWLAKWNNNFTEPNHNTYDINSAKEYIRNKYIYKKWYKSSNNTELEKPVLGKAINYKAKPNNKYNISKSFNESNYIKRHKASSSSRSFGGKLSSSYKNYSIEINKCHSFNGYNPYILLDDEQENFPFDYTPNNTNLFIDNYSNNAIESNKTENNIKSANSILNNNNNYLNKQQNINNVNNNSYTKNSHCNSNSNKKQSFDNYPVYAPRSSSLLNKALIDSVYHTNDTLLIDNKKVYYYKKKSHHHSTHY